MSDSQLVSRLLGIVCSTTFGGAVCGAAAASAMPGWRSFPASIMSHGPFGFIFGGVVGVFASMLTALLLWRKNLPIVMPIVFTPTLVAAFLAGLRFSNDFWSVPISVGTLLIACAAAWYFMPDLYPARQPGREHRCTHCGYDLRGLPSKTCPECGEKQSPSDAHFDSGSPKG